MSHSAGISLDAESGTLRRARWLEYLTLGWNAVEAVVGVAAGIAAGSASLIGFGLDSVIESLSGGVLLWRLKDGELGERRERRAQQLVGASFLVLGTYVSYESLDTLLRRDAPEASPIGIVLAAVSLVVMPILARAKRSAAHSIGSLALESDARQTDLCAYLSAVLLAGLLLNALLGWWWADPIAALGMVGIMIAEGRRALRGETCDTCHP